MKIAKLGLFSLLLCLELSVFAQQNLVYNGDFELYSTCPSSESSPWQAPNYEITKCLGWRPPTYGTSDYFNTCAVATNVAIPNNALGSQLPASGNGYCGIFASSLTGGGNYPGIQWSEYIQGRFVSPLISGHVYHISFYVSLAEQSQYAVTQIGAYISSNPISGSTSQPLNNIPQIESPENIFLTDSIAWRLIEGDYMAQGGEQYITIGNFHDSATTDTLQVHLWDPSFPNAYYYVDAVTAFDVTAASLNNIFTPNGDGINDELQFVVNWNDHVIIYDRWGLIVRQLEDGQDAWNGRATSGNQCADGTYYYVIYRRQDDMLIVLTKGFFQLLK